MARAPKFRRGFLDGEERGGGEKKAADFAERSRESEKGKAFRGPKKKETRIAIGERWRTRCHGRGGHH